MYKMENLSIYILTRLANPQLRVSLLVTLPIEASTTNLTFKRLQTQVGAYVITHMSCLRRVEALA